MRFRNNSNSPLSSLNDKAGKSQSSAGMEMNLGLLKI